MLTGESLSKVINLVGHRHGTRTRELVKVLRRLGFDCPDRLKHTKKIEAALSKVSRALVKIKWDWRSSWHWVAWADGLIFDPGYSVPLGSFSSFSYRGGRATSYLAVTSGSGWAPMRLVLEHGRTS